MTEFIPRTIESRGKSIDEAIFRGLMEMGVSIDEVDIETIQEGSKGLLGIGAKPYIVRLTTKPVDLTDEAEKEKSRPRRAKKPQKERVAAESNAERAEPVKKSSPAPKPVRPMLVEDPEDGTETPAPVAKAPAQRQKKAAKGKKQENSHYVPKDETVYTPYVPGETECPGADFLLGVLRRMGIDCGIGFADTPEALKFHIESDTMGILIGHRGETLDSLQYLTGLVVNRRREGYRRVVLDTENYRNKREDTLVRLARKLAGQVRSTGKPVTLEPMNPYERRVLHATLQSNPFVTTHSTGEEPNRRVVIDPVRKEG
ncbi:MAG: RNA-binding cell elongation regulator Jag/EloR [Christensenellales bacterium]|jgi:spoIIIJ-associated protein